MRALICWTYLPALWLWLVATVPLFAHAQSPEHYPIAHVIAVEGQAYVARGENKKRLQPSDKLYKDALIQTADNSLILIMLIDDTQITLGENSEIVIEDFILDPYDPEENKARFDLTRGIFLWVSGLVTKASEPDVEIKTPVATIGIRGTTVWGGGLDDQYGILTLDGLVNLRGGWGSLDLPAGKGVFFWDKAPAEEAKPWSNSLVERAIETVTFSAQDKAVIDDKINSEKTQNFRRRHDFRSKLFPYKSAPRHIKPSTDQFFTDEFIEMRENRARPSR